MKVVLMFNREYARGTALEGQQTNYDELILSGEIKHTIRSNCNFWCDKITQLQEEGGILSLRCWEDIPYKSSQIVIKDIPAKSVDIQFIKITRKDSENTYYYSAQIDSKNIDIKDIAQNEGMSKEGFIRWLDSFFLLEESRRIRKKQSYQSISIPFAVIQFSDFRY